MIAPLPNFQSSRGLHAFAVPVPGSLAQSGAAKAWHPNPGLLLIYVSLFIARTTSASGSLRKCALGARGLAVQLPLFPIFPRRYHLLTRRANRTCVASASVR